MLGAGAGRRWLAGTLPTFLLLLFATFTRGEPHSTTTIGQKEAELAEQVAKTRSQEAFAHQRDDLDKYQLQDLEEASKLDLGEPYLERMLTEELEKRASMRGFQGMRGKKNDLGAGESLYEAAYAYPEDYLADKRAPMGFQGMRGKKAFFEEADKRAPMGFQGMRGKKSLEEVLEELDKRAMTGFQGMRGKKEYEEEEAPEWTKRAPMGFQGMRGRKSSLLDQLDELEKRAILGFHGMRGKKDATYEDLPAANYVAKRPMMMGFHGMRGKRSTSYYGSTWHEKRSPYRFFGTRGKKNPRWEMRGKFVGVRGKKWTGAPRQRQADPSSIIEDLLLAGAASRSLH